MKEEMPDKKKNYYEILNLNKDCKSDEIKKSYIEMSKKCHPDKNVNLEYSHEKFLDICEAYNTLNNPLKRQQYDKYLSLKSQVIYDSSKFNAHSNNTYGFSFSSHSSSSASNINKLLLKLSRFPRAVMFATIVFITLCSTGFQFHLIQTDYDSKKALLENKSVMSCLIIKEAKEQARINGREEQLKRLCEGVLGQFDPADILDKYLEEINSPKRK